MLAEIEQRIHKIGSLVQQPESDEDLYKKGFTLTHMISELTDTIGLQERDTQVLQRIKTRIEAILIQYAFFMETELDSGNYKDNYLAGVFIDLRNVIDQIDKIIEY